MLASVSSSVSIKDTAGLFSSLILPGAFNLGHKSKAILTELIEGKSTLHDVASAFIPTRHSPRLIRSKPYLTSFLLFASSCITSPMVPSATRSRKRPILGIGLPL